MKCLVIVVFLTLLTSQVRTQELTDNPLLDAQYGAESMHKMFEGTFDNTRFILSDELHLISTEILTKITDALEEFDFVKKYVDSHIKDEQCLNSFNKVWERNTEAVGAAIQECAAVASNDLNNLLNNVFTEMEIHQKTSTALQLSVVRHITNFNVVDNSDYFYEDFVNVMETAYTNFATYVIPRLEDVVGAVFDSRYTIPVQLGSCINAAKDTLYFYNEPIEMCS